MNFAWDHLVHAVEKPGQAATDFAGHLGWKTTPGGQHVHWGTYNTLYYFDLSYIEWVGVNNRAVAQQSEFGSWVARDLRQSEGPSQFVLRTTQLDALVEKWKQNGLKFVGPVPGERQRPDGTVIRWRLLFPERTEAGAFPLPFVIEWAEPDEQRLESLIAGRTLPPDGCAPARVSAIHSVVKRVDELKERWLSHFPLGSMECTDEGVLRIQLPNIVLQFTEPASPELQSLLEIRGERPYQIDLGPRTAHPWNVGQSLAATQCRTVDLHGLRVRVPD